MKGILNGYEIEFDAIAEMKVQYINIGPERIPSGWSYTNFVFTAKQNSFSNFGKVENFVLKLTNSIYNIVGLLTAVAFSDGDRSAFTMTVLCITIGEFRKYLLSELM